MTTEARDALAAALYEANVARTLSGPIAEAILRNLPDGWVLTRREDAEDGAALALSVFTLAGFAQHRSWCPEADGPADCTCGLYGLLDAIQCVCGHKVSVHTTRQVGDVVGWPCNGCKSDRCSRFLLAAARKAKDAL